MTLSVDGRRQAIVFTCALALALYPPVIVYAAMGMEAIFGFLAADAFYYLAVAAHSVGVPFPTFDGEFPTNGFHPAWQYALRWAFSLFSLKGPDQVLFAFGASAFAAALGTSLFATALLRLTRFSALALAAAVPGTFYLFCLPAHPHYGASWSFMNGMESGFSVLLFGALAHQVFAHGPPSASSSFRRRALVSALLGAITLVRLDDGFIVLPFAAYLFVTAGSRADGRRAVLAFLFLPALLVGIYLVHNVVYSGTLLPTSGVAKGGLAFDNVKRLLTPFSPSWLFSAADNRAWRHETWRILQLALPALASLLFIARLGLRRGLRERLLLIPVPHQGLAVLGGYVVLKALYNFVFVKLWHQGHWYFPASIMTFNALSVVALDWVLARAWPEAARMGRAMVATTALGLVFMATAFAFLKRTDGYNQHYYRLWANRETLHRDLRERSLTQGIIDFDDGIIGYSLPQKALGGLGFVLDREALQARASHRLFALAYERGYRLMASLNYPAVSPGTPLGPVDLRPSSAHYLRDQDLAPWRFTLAHRDPTTGVAFIRFEPASLPHE